MLNKPLLYYLHLSVTERMTPSPVSIESSLGKKTKKTNPKNRKVKPSELDLCCCYLQH